MEYRKFGSDYVLRIQKGGEILSCIETVCQKENILLGTVTGLGAVGEIVLGVFDREKFAYQSRTYTGDLELGSCSGNISTMDGKTYLHIHAVAGNPDKDFCMAGHMSRAVVSLTGEFILHKIEGRVEREYSPEVGLNLFQFI